MDPDGNVTTNKVELVNMVHVFSYFGVNSIEIENMIRLTCESNEYNSRNKDNGYRGEPKEG